MKKNKINKKAQESNSSFLIPLILTILIILISLTIFIAKSSFIKKILFGD